MNGNVRMREERKIMININVGDYVETIGGRTGYVTRVELGNVYNTITVKIDEDNYCYSVFNCQEYDYNKHFKRIDSHDFTIKDSKIKPLNNMNLENY